MVRFALAGFTMLAFAGAAAAGGGQRPRAGRSLRQDLRSAAGAAKRNGAHRVNVGFRQHEWSDLN